MVTSWFDSVCVTMACWVNFKEKNIFMNMNYSSLTRMFESVFAQMLIFLVEKYVLNFGLIFFMVKSNNYCK